MSWWAARLIIPPSFPYNSDMTDDVSNDDKSRLISLPEAAKIYGFSAKYLSELAKKGRLKAQKIGHSYVTTPANVEEYIRSRKRMGVYRNDIQIDDWHTDLYQYNVLQLNSS